MTNHWCDIQNSDCIIIVGSNAAENHPVSFKWVTKAIEENGATLISIDPRFTRSSSKADIYAHMRSGTDIAFFGGMIKWVLDDMEVNPDLYNMTYVTEYTNAAFLIDPEFKTAAEIDGKFSGFMPGDRPQLWQVRQEHLDRGRRTRTASRSRTRRSQDPNCVFQLLKKQYARYDPDTVAQHHRDADKDTFLKICETYARLPAPAGKTGTIMYAMGTTQHTHGTQNIRALRHPAAAAGQRRHGGRRHQRPARRVQRAGLHRPLPALPHPARLSASRPRPTDGRCRITWTRTTPKTQRPQERQLVAELPKYYVSLLKSWYGDNATAANEFGYHWLPKLNPGTNYSHIALFEAMHAGHHQGLDCLGPEPGGGRPQRSAERQALEKLDWLVTVDLWETETCAFWQRARRGPGRHPDRGVSAAGGRLLREGGQHHQQRPLEPVALEGGRAAWRGQGLTWIVTELMLTVIELYEAERGPNPDPIPKLRWNYGDGEVGLRTRSPARSTAGPRPTSRTPMGKSSCRPAIRCDLRPPCRPTAPPPPPTGSTPAATTKDGNMMARRDNTDYHPAGIGPLLQVVLVLAGQPAHHLQPRLGGPGRANRGIPEDFVIRWNAAETKWEGDVPDGGWPPRTEHASLHHEAGGPRPHLWAGPGRRALPRALRAVGEPGRQPALGHAEQPGALGSGDRMTNGTTGRVSRSSAPPTGSPSTGRRGR